MLAEKPPQGQKNRIRRSRRRKSAASPYRIKEKLRSGPRLASGPHVDYNARLYDPKLGRFLSVDPVIAHPESTQGINPYSYVENNPLNRTDPTGEADTTCSGTGENRVCTTTGTITQTGSHIPTQVTATENMSTGKVTFSGPAATPGGGGLALTTDFNTTMSVSAQGSTAANSTNGTNVNAHQVSNQDPSTAGGTTSNKSAGALEPSPPSVINKGGNPKDIQAQLKKLPPEVLQQLKDAGVKIVAVKDSVVEYFPDQKGVKARGWGGKTWDVIPGEYDPHTKTVVIATSGRYGNGSYNLVLHEVGHAYDDIRGGLSNSPLFKAAYSAGALSTDIGLDSYLMQSGNAGRQETFAEGFARYYGGDPTFQQQDIVLYNYFKDGP